MAKRRKARKSGSGRKRRKNGAARAYPSGGGVGVYSAARTGANDNGRRRAKRRTKRRAGSSSAGVRRPGRSRRRYAVGTGPVRDYKRRGRGYVRGRAMRRVNGLGAFASAGIALLAGVAVSVAAGFLIDSALSTQTSTVQDGALLAVAAGSVYFIKNPVIAAGVATGLLLIPAAKLVYSLLPSLASANASNPENPNAMAAAVAAATTTTTTAGLGALHRRDGLFGMGSLHLGDEMVAGMGSLHREGMLTQRFASSGGQMSSSDRGTWRTG